MTDTIFFDVGNTLRIVIPDKEFSEAAENELMRLVGATEPKEVFFEKLEANWKKYRKEAKASWIDAGEMELWNQHLLPDYDPELVCRHAGRLTRLWRDHDGRRVPREDVKDTIIELDRRGYTLGIIANTITETEIPRHREEGRKLRLRGRQSHPRRAGHARRRLCPDDPHRRAGYHREGTAGDHPASGLYDHQNIPAAGHLPAAELRGGHYGKRI